MFPFHIGRVKITIFHFLLSCTIVFSLVWGFFIYSVVDAALKKAGDNYVAASSETPRLDWLTPVEPDLL